MKQYVTLLLACCLVSSGGIMCVQRRTASTPVFVSANTQHNAATSTCTVPLSVTSGNLVYVYTSGSSGAAVTLVDGNTRYTWSSHVASPQNDAAGGSLSSKSWSLIASATETLSVTATFGASGGNDCSILQYSGISSGDLDGACDASGCQTGFGPTSPVTFTTAANLTSTNDLVVGCATNYYGFAGTTLSTSNAGFVYHSTASSATVVCQDAVLVGGSGSTTSMIWAYTGGTPNFIFGALAAVKP